MCFFGYPRGHSGAGRATRRDARVNEACKAARHSTCLSQFRLTASGNDERIEFALDTLNDELPWQERVTGE